MSTPDYWDPDYWDEENNTANLKELIMGDDWEGSVYLVGVFVLLLHLCLIMHVFILKFPYNQDCNNPCVKCILGLANGVDQIYKLLSMTVLGTPTGIFDCGFKSYEEKFLIGNRKVSHLSMLTLATYVIFSVLCIFKISIDQHIVIGTIYNQCLENATTCLIHNNRTTIPKIVKNCSLTIDPEIIHVLCTDVTYSSSSDMLATAGGLYTVSKVVPKIAAVLTQIILNFLKLSFKTCEFKDTKLQLLLVLLQFLLWFLFQAFLVIFNMMVLTTYCMTAFFYFGTNTYLLIWLVPGTASIVAVVIATSIEPEVLSRIRNLPDSSNNGVTENLTNSDDVSFPDETTTLLKNYSSRRMN